MSGEPPPNDPLARLLAIGLTPGTGLTATILAAAAGLALIIAEALFPRGGDGLAGEGAPGFYAAIGLVGAAAPVALAWALRRLLAAPPAAED